MCFSIPFTRALAAINLYMARWGDYLGNSLALVITARKRSCGKVMFFVILFTGGGGGGGGLPSQHALQVISQHVLQVSGGVYQHTLQVSRPTPKGELEGSGLGVSRPTLGGSPAHTQGGCIPAYTEADPPWLMATAVGSTHPTGMHSCFQYFFRTLTSLLSSVIVYEPCN